MQVLESGEVSTQHDEVHPSLVEFVKRCHALVGIANDLELEPDLAPGPQDDGLGFESKATV